MKAKSKMTESITEWLPAIPGIIFSTIGFIIYQFINESREKKSLVLPDEDNVSVVLKQRLTGVIIFGLLPALLLIILTKETDISYVSGRLSASIWLWLFPLSILAIVINLMTSGREDNLNMYPQIRKKEWTIGLLILSALSWIAYLFAYELLFRGLLFVPLVWKMGLWPAIIINTGIYALVHIPKGWKESFGAIPVGIILCLLVDVTGSFWIAFFIHIVMALSNEWTSLKKHPEINLIIK